MLNIITETRWALKHPKPLTGCPICGGKLVQICGRHPKDPKREVCPTCLQERMDTINELSSKDYGITYKNE